MTTVTFQVLEGVDKGRTYRDLSVPVTVGREEGNSLRLNDERVSRFHAKVQQVDGDYVLTDLESTNGTRVNGNVIQIRRLRFGDRITVGRSLLLFGSSEQIAARVASLQANSKPLLEGTLGGSGREEGPATIQAQSLGAEAEDDIDFDLNVNDEIAESQGQLFIGTHQLPLLPRKLSPAQAARLAEILDFLHQHLTRATENIEANDEGTKVGLGFRDWQRILAVQMLLARYLRAVAEPDALQQ